MIKNRHWPNGPGLWAGVNRWVIVFCFVILGFAPRNSLAGAVRGQVVAWGAYASPNEDEIESGVREISSGFYHNLALKTNGTVVAWAGWNGNPYGVTNVPAGLPDVAAICTGHEHSLD
jgi:hypothetical protein